MLRIPPVSIAPSPLCGDKPFDFLDFAYFPLLPQEAWDLILHLSPVLLRSLTPLPKSDRFLLCNPSLHLVYFSSPKLSHAFHNERLAAWGVAGIRSLWSLVKDRCLFRAGWSVFDERRSSPFASCSMVIRYFSGPAGPAKPPHFSPSRSLVPSSVARSFLGEVGRSLCLLFLRRSLSFKNRHGIYVYRNTGTLTALLKPILFTLGGCRTVLFFPFSSSPLIRLFVQFLLLFFFFCFFFSRAIFFLAKSCQDHWLLFFPTRAKRKRVGPFAFLFYNPTSWIGLKGKKRSFIFSPPAMAVRTPPITSP